MGLKSIGVKNITVFEDLQINFSKGVNIIIGENGTGKTTLLKMIYAACELSNQSIDKNKGKSIYSYFNYGKNNPSLLVKNDSKNNEFGVFSVRNEKDEFEFRIPNGNTGGMDSWTKDEIKSVFIPTTEMLSHAKGFLALNQKYTLPFDATQIDIIVNAELPETREVSELNTRILKQISKIIKGEVVYENDTFYVVKDNGNKIEFSLEAEGLRKFALLWKLIRNGLIEDGSVLIWDEPEVSINPELIPDLVDIMLELQRNGVQIFIATHSYNLAKYFEIKKEKNDSTIYHSLYINRECINENNVQVISDDVFGSLKENPIISADAKLLDDVLGESING